MSIGLTYLRIVLSRWRLVLALVVLGTVGAWAVSVFYLATKPKFEAAARLNIVPTSEELGYASRFVRGSTFDGGSVLLGTYAEFARTRPVVAPIVDRFIAEQAAASGMTVDRWLAANKPVPGFSPGRILAILNYGQAPVVPLREELIEEVLEGTTIENVEGTYLIRLAVEWDDPQVAAWFANALADAIIARAERVSRSTGQQIAGTLEQRLAAKRGELAGVLRNSRDLKASVGVVDLDRQKQALLEARLTEQAQLTTDRAALDSARSQVSALRQQAGGKLSGAQTTVEQTLAVEGPRASGLARSVAVRADRIRQLDRQIAGLGTVEDRVKALDDRAVQLQQEVTALTERVSFSQTENLANAPRIQLIERATPPLTRSSPKIFVNTVLGFIGGCALAACALLLLGPAPRRNEEDEATTPVAEPAPIEPPTEPRPLAQVHHLRRATDRVPPPSDPAPVPAAPAVIGNAALQPEPEPEPEIRREPPAPALPRPADGVEYSAAELDGILPRLAPPIAAALTAGDRPVFVGAVSDEADASALAQIAHALLLRAGAALVVVDARQGAANLDAAGKPFVYLGAISDDDALAGVPADACLLLALRDDHVSPATIGTASAHVVTFQD